MRQQSYHNRGRQASGLGGVVLAVIVVGFGGFGVYEAIGWFRASNAADVAQKTVTATAETVAAQAVPMILDGSTPMLRPDGTTAGTLYRRGTSETCEYNTVLTLGALPEKTSYEVWAVKNGLADVASLGNMTARADGTFAVTFTQSDPLEYSSFVVMLEPNDGVTTPSGTIAATGTF